MNLDYHHTCEMWITREEFFRCLPAAVAHDPFDMTLTGARSTSPEAQWRFELTELPEHVITPLMRCPRLRVELTLQGYPADRAEAFVQRYLRHFQRGGG